VAERARDFILFIYTNSNLVLRVFISLISSVSFGKLKNIYITAFSSDISTWVLYTNDVPSNINAFSDLLQFNACRHS